MARSIPAALGLLALLASPASAQGVPTDTLDWHRYYPLAVGNAWEYHDSEIPSSLIRHELRADTVAGERTYFRRRTTREDRGSPFPPSPPAYDYVRYDASGYVLAVTSPAADTAAADACAEEDWFERPLPLGFGARIACPTTGLGDSLRVEGAYGGMWTPDVLSGTAEPVPVAAQKTFVVAHYATTRFVADIGPAWVGSLGGSSLHYARVGGVEYGTAEMTVGAEPPADRAALRVAIAPNPVVGRAVVRLELPASGPARVVVLDVMGRVVAVLHDGPLAAERRDLPFDRAAVAPGVYVVRVTAGGRASTARLVAW